MLSSLSSEFSSKQVQPLACLPDCDGISRLRVKYLVFKIEQGTACSRSRSVILLFPQSKQSGREVRLTIPGVERLVLYILPELSQAGLLVELFSGDRPLRCRSWGHQTPVDELPWARVCKPLRSPVMLHLKALLATLPPPVQQVLSFYPYNLSPRYLFASKPHLWFTWSHASNCTPSWLRSNAHDHFL